MKTDPRRTFGLRDLLAIAFVFAFLSFLAIQLIQSAKDASRRAQCQNNMRQIGLALSGFSSSKNAYPNAATFYDDPAIHQDDPRRSRIYEVLTEAPGAGGDSSALLRSWVIDILPYVDIADFYNAWNKQASYLSRESPNSWPENARLCRKTLFCPRAFDLPARIVCTDTHTEKGIAGW